MEIAKDYLDKFFENEYTGTILSVMLVLYGGLAAPKLPSFVRKLFENAIFRVIILALVAYGGNKNPKVAIIIAVAFILSMNMIRENDFVENFADDLEDEDDDDDDDDDNDDEDTEMEGEEEEMNECKKHIEIIFKLYKESKNDDIIDLGEKWRDFHKKRVEVIEKRSNLMRLICDSRKSLAEKRSEIVKVRASDSDDKKEEIKDLQEEVKEKVKEIKDIKKELVEYRKSEREELKALKKEFKEERKALRLRLAKNPKTFKKYNEVEKKIKLEARKYKQICREIYKLKCEKTMDESTSFQETNNNQSMNPTSNTTPNQSNNNMENFNKNNGDMTSNFENMNGVPMSESYNEPIPN